MQHTFDLISTDSNRLSNYGEDRTYSAFKYLLNVNLHRLVEFCLDNQPEEQEERYAQVCVCCFAACVGIAVQAAVVDA
jgi:hypothetical protein